MLCWGVAVPATLEEEAVCGAGQFISSWRVQFANVSGARAPKCPIVLSFHGVCSDGVVLPRYNTSEVRLCSSSIRERGGEKEEDRYRERLCYLLVREREIEIKRAKHRMGLPPPGGGGGGGARGVGGGRGAGKGHA